MRLLAGALAFALLGAAARPAAASGPRLVSLNLCSDQLVLALADPDQILGLSPFAHDPARPWIRDAAAPYRSLSGTAEEVLVLRPDLVLAGGYTRRATRDLLRARGQAMIELGVANSIADVLRQIATIGDALGHPDRARATIAGIEAAIARARVAASTRGLSILPLQRRGWISGRDTLMTSLVEAVGLRNAGAALSDGGALVRLEDIVALRPDFLLVTRADARAEDQGTALLQHPALRALYPPERRLALPEEATVCGGPAIAAALDRLTAEIERLR